MKNHPTFQRVLTGSAMILGLALSLMIREFLGAEFFDAFLLLILFFAVYEVMRATKAKDRGVKYHYVFAYLVFAYLAFWLGTFAPFDYWMHLATQLAVLLVFLVYTYFMYYVDTDTIRQCRLHKQNVGAECRSIIIEYLKVIGYPAAFVYMLFAINHMGIGSDFLTEKVNIGLFGLLLVFVISASTDTLAFAVGKTLKGPKLCPKISPKKTWSGAVGGLFGGVLGTLTLIWIYSRNTAFQTFFSERGFYTVEVQILFIIVGLLGSVVVQAGDIFASYIKRRHGIKDFGKILPGHGGVMDRMDGNIVCAAFVFFVLCIIVYIL